MKIMLYTGFLFMKMVFYFPRDIKPANVMLFTKDKNSMLKIIDFGTAKTF